MSTVTVTIMNSCALVHQRYYKHFFEFKKTYYDFIVARVFESVQSHQDIKNLNLILEFKDNHFSNVQCLDYKKLYKFLSFFFASVKFGSYNIIDSNLAPDYFDFLNNFHYEYDWLIQKCQESSAVLEVDKIEKMFGLHILRPDTHRLGMLVELHRKNLLEHFDVRLGFNSHTLNHQDYRRASNFDIVCWEFDIAPKELLELIDSLPRGDRNDFDDNKTYSTKLSHDIKDFEKIEYNKKFAIELVCDSSINDFLFDYNEKTIRPTLLKQPMIALTSQHHYRYSKLIGFQTFDTLWNESWDNLKAEFLVQKIQDIAKTCKFILDSYSIPDVFELTRSICQHNYNRLLEYATDKETHENIHKILGEMNVDRSQLS